MVQVNGPSTGTVVNMVHPFTALPVVMAPPPALEGMTTELGSVSSRLRYGFGGMLTVMMKSVKRSMSVADSGVARPSRPTNAPLKC